MTAYCLADLPPEIRDNVIVNPATGCWEWQLRINAQGYGCMSRNGIRQQRVHRIVYELLVEQIDPGLDIDHVQDRGCRSKACCWPYHLEPVTRAENTRRAQEWVIKRRRIAVAQRAAEIGIRTMSASAAQQGLTQLISAVEYKGEHVEIHRYGIPTAVVVPVEWYERAAADLSHFRVAGFDDEGLTFTQPVEVRCERCGEARTFTDRDDGGADHTESLSVLLKWAQDHQCKETGA